MVAWFHALQAADPAVPEALRAQIAARQDLLEVAPDPDRAILDYSALRALHQALLPILPSTALSDRGCYAFSPAEGVHAICLDTAVRSGSHEGALDADQGSLAGGGVGAAQRRVPRRRGAGQARAAAPASGYCSSRTIRSAAWTARWPSTIACDRPCSARP